MWVPIWKKNLWYFDKKSLYRHSGYSFGNTKNLKNVKIRYLKIQWNGIWIYLLLNKKRLLSMIGKCVSCVYIIFHTFCARVEVLCLRL